MLAINPIGAVIVDLALVESQFEAGPNGLPTHLTPTITFRNHVVDVPQADGLVAIGMESTVVVDVWTQPERDRALYCKYVVGCTVAAPVPKDGRPIDRQLIEYAITTNEGFVRTLIYQQTQTSQLPGTLIPPMAFDGTIDERS